MLALVTDAGVGVGADAAWGARLGIWACALLKSDRASAPTTDSGRELLSSAFIIVLYRI